MPRQAKQLSAKAVEALKEDGTYAVGGPVPGLYLQVVGGSRSWLLRASIAGKRRAIGLGPFPAVSLAEARQKAQAARQEVEKGLDPVTERSKRLEAARAAARPVAVKTFGDCAREYIEAHRPSWRNAKHAGQWASTLETHAARLMDMPVVDVDTPDILAVLRPLWAAKKVETGTRLRGRIELVLSYAVVNKYRPPGPNPAIWRGNLQLALPAAKKVRKVVNHPALPHAELPAFYKRLEQQPGMGARALQFAILTAARSGEVRHATWGEISGDTWLIPGAKMKSGRPHRVALSTQAQALLASLRPADAKPTDLIFTGAKKGTPISDMTITATLRRMKVEVTAHGTARSTFRDYVADRMPHIPRETAEAALAHVIGGTEGAYLRSDRLEQRRPLMQAWADFVVTGG